jgi:arginine decarboxylase
MPEEARFIGLANVVSDAAIHCVFVNWTLGRDDRKSHAQSREPAC